MSDSEPSYMGSDVENALEGVKLPGTTKYKIGDIVINEDTNTKYRITEINDNDYSFQNVVGDTKLNHPEDIKKIDTSKNYKLFTDTVADVKGTEADSKEGTDADSKEGAKGTEAESKSTVADSKEGTDADSKEGTDADSKEGAKGTEAESKSTVAESKGTSSSLTTPASAYIIVQINATGEISILDKVPVDISLNIIDSPIELLTKKTPSTFAIKITRNPGCTENCIDGYELGLKETISNIQENELLSEKFLEESAYSSVSSSSVSSSSVSSSSVVSEEVPLAKEATDDEKKIKFSNMLIDMGLATDKSVKELVEKYYNENYDEAIGKILNDIDSKKTIDVPSGSESSASSVPVIGGKHGPYGLRQVSETDCFISSVIHLMKDITAYDPNNPGDKCDTITYNGPNYDAKNINLLTASLYTYIDGTSENIETYKKSNPDHYIKAYKDLRNILGFKPGFGETTEALNVYSAILKCINPNTLTVHNLQNEDDMKEGGKKSDFENDGITIKNDFTTYGNTEYLVLNRTVESNDRDIWMAIRFPPEKDGYRLIGKILHPPGHFVYINYSDYGNPVIYNDSIVQNFSFTTSKNYLFMKEEQLTTSVLYKKDSASASSGGSSRRKQKSKSKKTRRKYFVYNK